MSTRRGPTSNLPARYASISPPAERFKPLPVSPVPPSSGAYNSNPQNDAPLADPESYLAQPTAFAGRGAFRAPSPGYPPSIRSLDSGAAAVSAVYLSTLLRSSWSRSGLVTLFTEPPLSPRDAGKGAKAANLARTVLILRSLAVFWILTKRNCC